MLNRFLGALRRVRARLVDDVGQTTAEYALVILGASWMQRIVRRLP